MSAGALLAELRRRDIRVWVEGDQLRCNAPAGALTSELRDDLRQHKREVVEFLRSAETLARQQRAIVPLQRHGERTAVFAVGGHNGDVFCYHALVRYLGEERPFFGLEPPGLEDDREPLASVEDLAAYFAAQINTFQPEGPCILAGFCSGGTIAFELGRQLQRQGREVRFVALLGSPYPTWFRLPTQLTFRLTQKISRLGRHARELAIRSVDERRRYIREKLLARQARVDAERVSAGDPALMRRTKVGRATLAAVRRYTPGHFAGPIGLFLPRDSGELAAMAWRWRKVAQSAEHYFGPRDSDRDNMLREPHASAIARLLAQSLDQIDRETAG